MSTVVNGAMFPVYKAQAESGIKLPAKNKTMTVGNTTTLRLKNVGRVKWKTSKKTVVSIVKKKSNRVTLNAKKAGIIATYRKKLTAL